MFGIQVKFPNGEVKQCRSKDTSVVIGKDAGCKLALSGWRISKRHAELFVSNERVFVRDLGSSSGTFVNNEKVSTAGPLQAADVISVAGHEIRVQWRREAELAADVPATVVAAAVTRPCAMPAQALTSSSLAGLVKTTSTIDELFKFRKILQEQLVGAFGVRRTDVHRMADAELRELTEKIIADLIERLPDFPPHLDRQLLLSSVRDEAIGLGLLEPLLADATVTEIMVNASNEIFVERLGRLEQVPMAFTSDQTVLGIIERIVAPIGRRIDESSPMVDARLKDGSRVNAIIPPLTLKGPSLTIRKFSKRKLAAADLLQYGSASQEMIDFLRVCVEQHKNMIVSGGTGSGKTTLLNILSNFIPTSERVVTIEDAAELQLGHPNLVSMESRAPNIEGKGQVAIRDLVKNALRMRPDRIVVGECRGGEALDMLQAMNTGHDGSLTTAHANTPRDMLSRLEVMVLMSGMDLPVTAIREQVASAVHLIVQQTRLSCGARKITSITEVTGIESGKIQLQEIFEYVQEGFTQEGKTFGYFTGRGTVPEFYENLARQGVPLDLGIFKPALRGDASRSLQEVSSS